MTKTIAELLQDLDDDTDALGQLIATNLNTMGVTGASASDGLTTLANKILDIQGVLPLYNYNNDGSTVNGLIIGSGVSCTSNGSYITITTSTSGEKDVKLPINLTGDWQYEVTLAEIGNVNHLTFKIGNGNQWGALGIDNLNYVWLINLGSGTSTYNLGTESPVGKTLKITYINGTMNVYWNNELLKTGSVSVSNTAIGFYTNSGRIQYVKDLKLKSL